MDREGNSLRMIASFILGVGATLTLVVFYQAANFDGEKSLEKLSFGNGTVNATHQEQSPFSELAPLLKRVADEDRTIIMTSVNWACAKPGSLLDLFLQSFQTGEKINHFLKHLLIIAFDPPTFKRCKSVHPFCYQIKVNVNFTAEQTFNSNGYIDLVWSKIELQRYILELGYNFLFTDVDILWFRNPFKHVTVYADMTTSSDQYNGDPDDISNPQNTGFFYVKSNNRTIQMMRFRHDARKRFPPDHEQNIFSKIKHELADSHGINIQFVDPIYFTGFCQYSADLTKVCTVHSNCCGDGLGAKLHDLRDLMDYWKNYTTLPTEEKNNNKWYTWTKHDRQCNPVQW
ncbi:nucleotide-diphospho-sugar transferase family protein [Rhynchospora pubera]|uniref:Nucleotide-diphospho-sugar transferase family protein n=1 Tax=Rhynchospora pubera TaxID=906938 RepID=A0AAV8CRZ1_9POAL|nr:nucleotide-diphospho-sugar transferase family protein [Rhynchospora pubera]